MVSVIEPLDERYRPIVHYVFGQTMICRNMETATKLAKQHGYDCVTKEGASINTHYYLLLMMITTCAFACQVTKCHARV